MNYYNIANDKQKQVYLKHKLIFYSNRNKNIQITATKIKTSLFIYYFLVTELLSNYLVYSFSPNIVYQSFWKILKKFLHILSRNVGPLFYDTSYQFFYEVKTAFFEDKPLENVRPISTQ